MEFRIREENFERLEKKLKTIQNKCLKYGNDFSFSIKGEEFRKERIEDTDIFVIRKYIVIDVEGEAKVDGWEFIASIEHTGIENGNIIKSLKDVEIPERFYSTECICEHCKSNRVRRNTFLIRNTETGEFRQIGKACLRDYTNGLSAEMAAQFANAYEACKSAHDECGIRPKAYFPIKDILAYASEIIDKMGYAKSEQEENSTKNLVRIHYCFDHHSDAWALADFEEKKVRDQRDELSFDFKSAEANAEAESALEWIQNADSSEFHSNYLHNLKSVSANDYVSINNIGILVSLIPAYQREVEKQKEIKAKQERDSISNYVGEIGQRISINIVSAEVLTYWETDFGTTYLNKMVDAEGNIYIWKSSKSVAVKDFTGICKMTVKAHQEYNGAKQTEVQRVQKQK